ncbi:transketolase-like [Oppia nitens]|uniref:transketolase-like n=1 Tax=Oppia nitens TaxID=1686743 RepID=UPI0023DC2612|nr:transketolase-like [Oppia nitens]XP_054160794.1 transketolase-like [Oppia nitens]
MSVNQEILKQLEDMANQLRIDSVRSTNAAKSGHPTSCASMADIMSVLFFHTMKYSLKEPKSPSNDRFILSKGHAAPILYAAWAEAGLFPVDEILKLRKLESDLEGHPTPRLNFIDVATGSLGQGLSVAAGMAYIGKYVDKAPYRVYCLIGDGESAEGSIWEALSFASIYKLDNLVAIFDVNRLGQSEATPFGHQMEIYENRVKSFGCETIVVDGHNINELVNAFDKLSKTSGKPQAIVAQTYKGSGFPNIENKDNWHGKPLGDKADDVIASLKQKITTSKYTIKANAPVVTVPATNLSTVRLSEPPNYKKGEKIATRQTYGLALVKLGRNCDRVIAMDGDTKNSTFSETYKKEFPNRYIECYIAEQNLVGVGIGAGCRNRTIPFVSTFASFFTRAFDQLRMGAISQANIKCVGSHCGVSIGEDGPSQMALEDIAMFRTIPHSTVYYPSDAVSTERAVELAAQNFGIAFIRTSRPTFPVIYDNNEQFAIGKAKVVKHFGGGEQVLLIGAGVTLHEAITAADELASKHQIKARVIDPFTIKPLDKQTILTNARECGSKVITVEDHYPEGGLGEAVSSALVSENIKIKILAVRDIPRSGPPQDLIDKYGIGSKSIVEAVLNFK